LQPLASFVRETIPLQAAVGLVRDGHLYESLCQGWSEIALPKPPHATVPMSERVDELEFMIV
jgi:hypothetical protein